MPGLGLHFIKPGELLCTELRQRRTSGTAVVDDTVTNLNTSDMVSENKRS